MKELGPGTLPRRLAAMAYDSMLLIAVFFFATLPVVVALGTEIDSHNHYYSLYLLIISLLYFGWSWRRGGQTLGMKTWKLKLCTVDGQPVTYLQILIRFSAALLGLLALGIGFWWGLFNQRSETLHDRVSRTRLILVDPKPARIG